MSGIHQLLLGGSAAAPAVDPYFYSVTSLLHGDGTNGAQNNTFLDSSTNNFTITRNGNTTQGSFSPFSQTGWGNYFNGSSYISAADNAALDLGTGDFTIEGWVYIADGITDNAGIVSKRNASGFNAGDYRISYRTGTSKISFANDTVNERNTPVVQKNSWTHFAIVRASGTLSAYANGVRGDTVADSVDLTNGEIQTIGVNATFFFTGYMSNIRIVKGTAVYSGSTYTVPTAPLTAITNTSLLTCQANRFFDASSNAFAISTSGSPSVQPFSPFNPTTAYSTSAVGGSGYFDGSGDYLTLASNAAFNLSSGAYTAELFIYFTTAPTTTIIFNLAGTGTTGYAHLLYDSGTLYWQQRGTGTNQTTYSWSPTTGQWYHIAIGWNGSNSLAIWINGARVATNTVTPTGNGQNGVALGAASDGYAVGGYINGFRIVKGTDVYGVGNSTITVPTAPLTAISNTSLLCNFTNAGIFDNAAVADYETVGNAQISTSVKKYGTGSMYFDGNGDYLISSPGINFALGTGDFTVEFWFYATSVGTNQRIVQNTLGGFDSTSYIIRINGSSKVEVAFAYPDVLITSGATIANNTWYHVALVRVGTSVRLYLNGTLQSTGTSSGNMSNQRLYIGGYYSVENNEYFTGYVDDVRVSKGIARYPYNFTPPTAEFPNIGGTVTLTADPYYDYTTLLLPGNGTNGAQNNTFLDSSTNNFTITRNGNTTQGTFSPFSQTGWGNYFDGSGDYLETPSNAAFTLGSSGDFTVECWVYATATPGNYAAFMTTWSDANTGYPNRWFIGVHDSKIKWYNDAGGSAIADSSNIQLNTWLHVAVARSGSTITLYINGTAIGTQTTSQSYTTQGTVKLGYSGTGGNYFSGYISNARVVKGTAVYTAAFTPPTAPLTAITNTSLLTCQSNRFVDNSSNAFAITRNGDVSVQAFSPFNPTAAWSAATYGGSGYFDGSGDYLTVSNNAALQMGSGDFTIEYWWYPTSIAGYQNPIDKGYTQSGGLLLQTGNGDGQIIVYASGSAVITASTAVRVNAWNHMALVRNGTSLVLYLNGASVGSATNSTNFNNASDLGIGATAIAPSGGSIGSFPIVGYLNGVRFVKGTAVYTAAFTPPTAPLTAITNTSLLLNFTNAGIYDATSKNDLETVGNAQISTTQSKFGGSSMYFDGSGDWLKLSNNTAAQAQGFGTGDFTIECWVYITSSTVANNGIYDCRYSASATGPLIYYIPTSGLLMFYNGSNQISGGTITINTWNHIALVRYSGVTKLYINGTQSGSNYADTNNYTSGANSGAVGAFYDGTGGWNGYIDDLRVTRGIARYTSNFTPPTTAFLTL